MSASVRVFEGVRYTRWIVRFSLASGERRRWVRWSPGHPWVTSEVLRELSDRIGVDRIKPGSVTIRKAAR